MKREQLLLYAVADAGSLGGRPLITAVEEALRGGVTCVQLRDKGADEARLLEEIRLLKPVCAAYGVPLIVNDNLSAALKGGAQGVHLGLEDTPVREARAAAGEGFLIGATAKTTDRALAAQSEGADYLGVGALFASPTKSDAVRVSQETVREICETVKIPVVAIGGITEQNAALARSLGADGVAVVSALFGARDIAAAAKGLKAAFSGART